MKICKNCVFFPCTKPQCQIGKQGCNDYESIVSKEIKDIGKRTIND